IKSLSTAHCTCTKSQLLFDKLADGELTVGNVETAQVVMVGIIRNSEKVPVNIMYKVNDMTVAPVAVHQQADTDDNNVGNTVVPPESYKKVTGHLRSFQNNNNKKKLFLYKEINIHVPKIVNIHIITTKLNYSPAGRKPISKPAMCEERTLMGRASCQQMTSL
ncbi:LOW QUALITY PROTEIN: Replication protein A 32 kDa subunit, partial [Galemys pyrenaicus]